MDWRFFNRWIHPQAAHAPPSVARAVLAPWGQSPATREERAVVILSRCRVIAFLFAILTPAWIGVDALTFSGNDWKALAAGRIAAALLFAGIGFYASLRTGAAAAFASVASLFAVPIVFFFIPSTSSPISPRWLRTSLRIPPISIFPSSSPRVSVSFR